MELFEQEQVINVHFLLKKSVFNEKYIYPIIRSDPLGWLASLYPQV